MVSNGGVNLTLTVFRALYTHCRCYFEEQKVLMEAYENLEVNLQAEYCNFLLEFRQLVLV